MVVELIRCGGKYFSARHDFFSIFSLGHTKTCQPLQTTANFSPSGRDLSALFGSEKSSTGALALSLYWSGLQVFVR